MSSIETDLTYGRQVNEALLQLGRAIAQPIHFAGPGDAFAVAQARTRLYRVAARIITVCATGSDPPVVLAGPEARSTTLLLSELNLSAATTRSALALPAHPPTERSTAAHLTRAADAAGLAWDLLATRLTPEGEPDYPTGWWVVDGDARAVLTDALLLVRGTASLDEHLGQPLWTVAADATVPAASAAALRAVADDCQAVTTLGLPVLAGNLLRRIAEPLAIGNWQRIDAVTAAPVGARPGRLATPAQAAAATDAYLTWLMRRRSDLTVPDLASLAATAARLSRVVGASTGTADSAAAGCDAVRAWRLAHQALRPLRSVHPRPVGWRQAFLLADWADRHVRSSDRARSPTPDMPAAAAAIAGQLPWLAETGAASVRRLHDELKLLAPVGPDTPPSAAMAVGSSATASRYQYGPADPVSASQALDAFTAARRASAALTHTPATAREASRTRPGAAKPNPLHYPSPARNGQAGPRPTPTRESTGNAGTSQRAGTSRAAGDLAAAVEEAVHQLQRYRDARHQADLWELRMRWQITGEQAAAAWRTDDGDELTMPGRSSEELDELRADAREARRTIDDAVALHADDLQLDLANRFGLTHQHVAALWERTQHHEPESETLPGLPAAKTIPPTQPRAASLAAQAFPASLDHDLACATVSTAGPTRASTAVSRSTSRRSR